MSILIPLIQKIFELDPDHHHLLGHLHGKKFGISITEWALEFTLVPSEEALTVIKGTQTADVTLTGKLPDFLSLSQSQKSQGAFTQSNLNADGDIRVMSLYQDFFNQLELDWTRPLTHILGEKGAMLIKNPLEKLGTHIKRQIDITRQNIPEILQEEKALLPSRLEMNDFFDDIKSLQMAVDRLEKRHKGGY